jgi:CotH kinase protein/Lamin Tail Domain
MNPHTITAALLLIVSSVFGGQPDSPRLVINEIMHHPPGDRDDWQYVELFNPGNASVDLSGWSFSKGIKYVFPRQTMVPGNGFVVVCRDLTAFKAAYGPGTNVLGPFEGRLRHRGESLELDDDRGQMIDAVSYGGKSPWPLGANGSGSSLERICPTAPGNVPSNWAASESRSSRRAGGTPGRRNSRYSAEALPWVSDVRFGKTEPGNPTEVTAAVEDTRGVQSVSLLWGLWAGTNAMDWAAIPMRRQSGDERQGVYAGAIPAQPAERLIRFTVQARNQSGAERICPAPSEPRPSFTFSTFLNTNDSLVPFLRVLSPAMANLPRRPAPTMAFRAPGIPSRAASDSAVVYLPPGGKEVQVFDYVRVHSRKGGWKVQFHPDQPLGDKTGIFLLYKGRPRYLLTEPLAQELYRQAGVLALATDHVRLWVNRRALGYYLLIEQPNKAYFRRHGQDDKGNLYKAVWYGQGIIGQHKKKTNRQTGHQDIIEVVQGLNRSRRAAQWAFIQDHFDVDELINSYAVSMCIQDWDGYFNNYYAYHDSRPGGKWRVIPWDKDKTWGDYDGASPPYSWYEMPLTFGMNNDPLGGRSIFGGGGPFGGGTPWWRPAGYFSGPLLANPEFRRRFLSRLREICNTVFTPANLGPTIDAMEKRLEPEVRFWAQLYRQRPEAALEEFHADMRSFRNQIVHRRQFILKKLETGAAQ